MTHREKQKYYFSLIAKGYTLTEFQSITNLSVKRCHEIYNTFKSMKPLPVAKKPKRRPMYGGGAVFDEYTRMDTIWRT